MTIIWQGTVDNLELSGMQVVDGHLMTTCSSPHAGFPASIIRCHSATCNPK